MPDHNAEKVRLCAGCAAPLREARTVSPYLQAPALSLMTCDTAKCPGNLVPLVYPPGMEVS